MFLRIFEKVDKYVRIPIQNLNILKNFDLDIISYKKEIFSIQILVGGIKSNNFKKENADCEKLQETEIEAPF